MKYPKCEVSTYRQKRNAERTLTWRVHVLLVFVGVLGYVSPPKITKVVIPVEIDNTCKSGEAIILAMETEGHAPNKPPLFKGQNYDYWKQRMMTFFDACQIDM
ncbi:hypothetical protein CR513_38830, partial [Mucuna pruriens]